MTDRKYKYYPRDFPELKVEKIHYDLVFDVHDDHTISTNKISFTAKEDLDEISLDAKKLEILEVEFENEINWNYDEKKDKLFIKFKNQIKKGQRITIKTKQKITPTWNDLEGLYFDKSPADAPPQQITQCQQWGYQKLTPSFDYMNAKSTYVTKIIANKKYTHLISNGNVVEKGIEGEKQFVTYSNELVPMAPYMFFLGVGTWKENNREFEYANGKKFNIQMLTLENATDAAAKQALEILAYGIQWVNIFTGGQRHINTQKRKEIFDLCFLRDKYKEENNTKKVEEIRKKLLDLSKEIVFGYEYTGEIYREIAMQNSNFGGMENVGNTTISANRMLPFKEMSDRMFTYLLNVKTHEFYHNLNGNEVTSYTPFDLWLNEAITEYTTGEEFISFATSPEYGRLENVSRIISKGGTFDEDTGALGHPMKPNGFNTPDELITGITYSKGPEIIRMIRLVLGDDKFYEALQKYHDKFKHSNATTQDFINSMSEFAKIDLTKMVDSWISQTGYPTLVINSKFEKGKVILELNQTGFKEKHWEFPFEFAIFDKKGNKIYEDKIIITEIKTQIEINNINEIGFFSFNRGLSFYGKVEYNSNNSELLLQVEKDDDIISKHIAFYKIVEREREKALKSNTSNMSDELVDLYFNLLSNNNLTDKLGTELLGIPGGVEDKYLRHYYNELYNIGKTLRRKIAIKYEKELLSIYNEKNKKEFDGEYVKKTLEEIKNRSVKNACLGLLSELDKKEINKIILEQFRNAKNQTDKLVGLSLYLETSEKDKFDILEEFRKECINNPVAWEQYLSVVARMESDDVVDKIKEVKNSKEFDINQSNDQRALLVSFAMHKRKSLLTQKGRDFLESVIVEVAKLNEYTAMHLLGVFEELEYMKEEELSIYVEMLLKIRKELSFEKQPSIFNNIKKILDSSPRAIKKYESEFGKIELE
jgi:aminopeptidase N